MTPFRERFISLLVSAALLSAPGAAMAWSNPGHRMVGALAQRHLTTAANAEVARLLQGEAEPTLAGIASWADELRKSSPEEYKRTESWHYINYPVGTCNYEPLRYCPNGDCLPAQIEKQRTRLADRSQPLAARRDALKFLVHLVGDVHQPLHNSNRGDKGGNNFQISLRTDLAPRGATAKDYVNGVMGTNLHSVWDYYVLASAKRDANTYVDWLDAAKWPPAGIAVTNSAYDWSVESCRLIEAQHLYPRRHHMDSTYLDLHRPLAERQVKVAAKRLADLLNTTLAP